MNRSDVQSQSLGWGLVVEYGFPSFDSVEVTVRFRSRRVWGHTFAEDDRVRSHRLCLGLLRLRFTLSVDVFAGTLVRRVGLDVRPWFRRPWRTAFATTGRSVLLFDPSVGEIAGRTAVYPPEVHDPVYGDSQSCTDSVLRIHVDEQRRDLCGVGAVVKARMFPRPYPAFVFNVVACVGAFAEHGPQRYTDPESPWFNVFLGYYQLDCAKQLWDRPFGFESAAGAGSVPRFEDLVRLGKSDWNFFSNWVYGVPEDALAPFCTVDLGPDGHVDHGLVEVAGRHWRVVDLLGVEVASCYEADAPGARRLVSNTVVTPLTRRSFGFPDPRPDHPTSFVPQSLDATLYMAYVEDEASYHTLIFGGTAHTGQDRALLATEIGATTAVIAGHYADQGFA
ncbi:MAG: hypothetical protein ABSF84_03680 [Acidimicrobiales bacterium]|jgi:hypothetical protein